MSAPEFVPLTLLDVAVPVLLSLLALACASAVYWLIHELDNEDAGR